MSKSVLRPTRIAAAVCSIFLVSHAARAEDAPAPAPVKANSTSAQAPVMQTVMVKGSAATYDARRDDTASKVVVNSEEIQKYGDTSVNDVLKRLPGITVGGAAGRGGGEIRMRGLGSGYTQILINGEKAPAGFSIDNLAPDVIERIEVLRAASAEFSTQSIAGTINIVLKKTVKLDQHVVKISGAKGSTFSSPSASIQWSDRDGALSYSMGANAWRYQYDRTTPSYETGTDAAGVPDVARASTWSDRGRSDGFNLSPRLNWALGDGDTLTWQTFINYNTFTSNSQSLTSVELAADRGPDYDRIDGNFGSHNGFARTDLNWVKQLGDGAKLDAKFGINGNRNASDGYNLGSKDGAAPTLDRKVVSKTTEQGFSSQGKYSRPLVLGATQDGVEAPEHALSLGWDVGVTDRDDTRRQREAPLPGSNPANFDEDFSARITRVAVYGQDEWNVSPSWSMYAGVRWEGYQTEIDGAGFASVNERSSVLSPLFQTLYKLPNKKDQLRLALTRTYKAPATSNMVPRNFISANNSRLDPDRRGNPRLKPEVALGLDASFEHYWGDGAMLSASASLRQIDDYTHNVLMQDGERWLAMQVNDGRAETRGIELEAKFPLRAVFNDVPAIDVRASVSRNWSRVNSVPGPDNRLDQQVPLSATVGLDYKSADGELSTGTSFSFRNGGLARLTDIQSGYNSVRRDLDVYALWKIDTRNNVRVAVSNLLAQDYSTESLYADAQGTSNRSTTNAGETQFRLTVERRF
ncbi:outer membrane receptor protein [Duganella sp. Leaf61]|uniref:TonB-dependent receptor plug domain-containing protein n=1 Tax=Duganella sp. Leaf61 TaxID=1736227 RepID=UPI0006F415A3|nr:TonB-dependent receptor [Duganella sp. Leaf61]KQN77072.1 outer membrane receptor protein [Duganella sp. Leaf61]